MCLKLFDKNVLIICGVYVHWTILIIFVSAYVHTYRTSGAWAPLKLPTISLFSLTYDGHDLCI